MQDDPAINWTVCSPWIMRMPGFRATQVEEMRLMTGDSAASAYRHRLHQVTLNPSSTVFSQPAALYTFHVRSGDPLC